MRKTKIKSLEPQTLQDVSRLGRTVRNQFDCAVLISYERRRRHYLIDVLPQLSGCARKRVETCRKGLNTIYGLARSDHSFDAPTIDWGIKLTEPNATRGIAHLLNRSSGDVRAKRVRAFFCAIKSRYVPTMVEARSAIVEAEKNRIDLILKYKKTGESKYLALIVEAKFEHIITEGQLSNYRQTIQADKHIDFKRTQWVILGPDVSSMRGLKGKQAKIWKFVAWQDLWLRFEKKRPVEDNPNLPIFLQWLWRRIVSSR